MSGDLGQRPRKYRLQTKNAVWGHLWRFVRTDFNGEMDSLLSTTLHKQRRCSAVRFLSSSAALGLFQRKSHGGLSRRVRAVSGDLGQRPRKYRLQTKNAVWGHLWRFVRTDFNGEMDSLLSTTLHKQRRFSAVRFLSRRKSRGHGAPPTQFTTPGNARRFKGFQDS